MARLVPSSFPYDSDSSAWAEKTFFEACRTELADEWLVLYSQRFVGKRSSLGQKQGLGEVDFLLLHKVFGIIAVEVKGGQIDIDEGQWFSSNTKGRFSIKNPFVQAEEGSQVILSTLKQELPELRLKNCVHHCVVFPAVSGRSIGNISTYGPREIVILKEDLTRLTKKIEQVVAHWGQKPRWTDEDFKLIKNVLIPTTKTPGVSYMEYVNVLRALDGLTESQLRTIRQLTKDKGKSVVTGGAGTGKTVLGMSRAQQLAQEGNKVLYLCANSSLAQYLQMELEALGPPISENLSVNTATAFVTQVGKAGTIRDEYVQRKKEIPSRSDRFLDAVSKQALEGSIDCLVVDEAQDIARDDLVLIEFLVKTPEEGGTIIILGDPNQQIYLRRTESALGLEGPSQSHSLDVNCRNTREIASIAHSFTDETVDTLESVSGIKVRTSRLRTSLLDHLVSEIKTIREEYDPGQLVVLTLNGLTDLGAVSDVFIDGPRSEIKVGRNKDLEEKIPLYSVRSFQGREADAVVVALTEISLLRTFPFSRFSAEMRRNSRIVSRQQARNDLSRVEDMFERYRNSTVRKLVTEFEQELDVTKASLTNNRKTFLVGEYQRRVEMLFEPRFSDPILDRVWKEKQRQSLKVSLYSMMTRARVILSVIGDDQSLKFIETELNSRDDTAMEYLSEL
jgi:AAA domain/Nuclease-related domain